MGKLCLAAGATNQDVLLWNHMKLHEDFGPNMSMYDVGKICTYAGYLRNMLKLWVQCNAWLTAASRDRNLLPHKIQEIKMERNSDLKLCRMNLNEISFTKGQLISKFFLVSSILPKTELEIFFWPSLLGQIFFVRFLEELKKMSFRN